MGLCTLIASPACGLLSSTVTTLSADAPVLFSEILTSKPCDEGLYTKARPIYGGSVV